MTQGERITKIETQVDYIKSDVGDIKNMLAAHIEIQNGFLTNDMAKKAYAGIWVESWVKGAVFSIGIGALVAILISQL
jgi:hypothetical protein